MITVCRTCRGAIEQRTTLVLGWVRWVHTESGDPWCPPHFGIATASPIIEGVGTPTLQPEKDTP